MNQSTLLKLTRICLVVRYIFLAFLIVQIIFFILSWVKFPVISFGKIHVQLEPDGITTGLIQQMSSTERLMGIILGIPGLLTLTYAFIRLSQTLRQFQKGNIFGTYTITRMRGFAGAMLITTAIFNLEKPTRTLLFNFVCRKHTYNASIEITSNEVILVLVCSLFYLICQIMQEGRRISEENEEFI